MWMEVMAWFFQQGRGVQSDWLSDEHHDDQTGFLGIDEYGLQQPPAESVVEDYEIGYQGDKLGRYAHGREADS